MTTRAEANERQAEAMQLVREHAERRTEHDDPLPGFDVFVVWFSKTLQNWKALVATTLPDQTYYEVTYDGDKRVTYLDVYEKLENHAIPDED